MAISVRCPNCAASLVFDADTQRMTCSFCGTSIRPEDLTTVSGGVPEATQVQQEVTIPREPTSQNHEQSTEQGAKPTDTPSPWTAEAVSYLCGNCGAAVVTDQNTVATFCAFCGSPTIIPERLVEGLRPADIIPFKYGREEAVAAFFSWCKKGLMTPQDFVSNENIEKLTGVYVPFFLYDIEVDMDMQAEAVTVDVRHSSNSTTTTTKYYDARRQMALAWDRIPLDGASHVDDKMIEILEPYDYQAILPFEMKYLSGFYAEKYDIPAEALEKNLYARAVTFARETFEDSMKQYKEIKSVHDASVYHKPRYRYALMPVWMLNYSYRGKKYTFMMNGQTGKIAGEPPMSPVKLALLFSSTLLGTSSLVYLLGGLL